MYCANCQQALKDDYCASCELRLYPLPEDFISLADIPYYPMKTLEAGQFVMGSPPQEEGRDPDEEEHEVILDIPFAIGCTEVPQDLYMAVMGDNPSAFVGQRKPVETISWIEACSFCNAFSRIKGYEEVYVFHKERVTWKREAKGFRLPTEAEWEYAARKAQLHAPLSQQAWFIDNSNFETQNVGLHRGIADMAGNVWEWVWDWYGAYPKETRVDPTGPETGTHRCARGGCWADSIRVIRPANRAFAAPDHKSNTIGFRLAQTLSSTPL